MIFVQKRSMAISSGTLVPYVATLKRLCPDALHCASRQKSVESIGVTFQLYL